MVISQYILSKINANTILCQCEIQNFKSITRKTLDISCAAPINLHTNLPLMVGLSHSLREKDINFLILH